MSWKKIVKWQYFYFIVHNSYYYLSVLCCCVLYGVKKSTIIIWKVPYLMRISFNIKISKRRSFKPQMLNQMFYFLVFESNGSTKMQISVTLKWRVGIIKKTKFWVRQKCRLLVIVPPSSNFFLFQIVRVGSPFFKLTLSPKKTFSFLTLFFHFLSFTLHLFVFFSPSFLSPSLYLSHSFSHSLSLTLFLSLSPFLSSLSLLFHLLPSLSL